MKYCQVFLNLYTEDYKILREMADKGRVHLALRTRVNSVEMSLYSPLIQIQCKANLMPAGVFLCLCLGRIDKLTLFNMKSKVLSRA